MCVSIINSVPPPAKCVFFYIRMAGGRILSNTMLIINTGAKERDGSRETRKRTCGCVLLYDGLSMFSAFPDRKSAGCEHAEDFC